jgi:glycosyltransferase involved in cell wall biosynthesis
MRKRVAIVVQRFGREINGGAEYHARLIAKHLHGRHAVDVLTTCAVDYVTWSQHYPEGTEVVEGIPVRRFRVDRERDPKRFGDIQKKVVDDEHTPDQEILWMDEQGPVSSDLRQHLEAHRDDYDLFIFFSFRYHTTFTLLPLVAGKSILVPTAEHDDIIYLRLFRSFFHLPAAIAYNSIEERDLIWRVSQNRQVPGIVVGVGSEIPSGTKPEAFRAKFAINYPFILYLGRLDRNKGIPELFDFFLRFKAAYPQDPTHLVLAGKTILDIPDHPHIHYLGFIDDTDKFDALAASRLLVIPSQYESLSMVTLEAWALGKPVLANGRTDVLRGQCQRSQAGLWYTDYDHFRECLLLMSRNGALCDRMGENGRAFFYRHYDWPVIGDKYDRLMALVS